MKDLRLKLSTTTNPDLESTLSELEESLERAKNLTAALETESAADRISNVEKEIENLNKPKEIELPQLDFSSIDPYYLIIPIAFVLLIAIILIKFRGKENKGLGVYSGIAFMPALFGMENVMPGTYTIMLVVGLLLIGFVIAVLSLRKKSKK